MNLTEKELNNEWKQELIEKSNKDEEVLNKVKNKVCDEVFQAILLSIEESENTFDYEITENPEGILQDETSNIKEWVNQTCNGGDFSGTVSIQISNDEYFKFGYSM